jgi:serine/threonine protein phosphatase PrpC
MTDDQNRPEPGEQSDCPVCAEPVFGADRFCEACGHDLSTRAPAPVPVPPRAPAPAAAPAAAPAPGPDAASVAEPALESADEVAVESGFGDPAGYAADPAACAAEHAAEHAAGSPAAYAAEPAAATASCPTCGAPAVSADGYCDHCGRRQPSERDHVEIALDGVCAVTDKGLRHHHNEDAMALTVLDGDEPVILAVVSDGVSTSPRPEEASQAAVDTGVAVLADLLGAGGDLESATLAAATEAAAAVAGLAPDGGPAPACTYVSAAVTADVVTVGWVGDSRAYWLGFDADGPHPPSALTIDDSWATHMVALGVMDEAEAQASRRAHTLTGWFGADAGKIDVHVESFAPTGTGAILVCSDGLWNYLPAAADLASAVPYAAADPLAAARALVRTALDAGGRDNITVAVIPFPPVRSPHPVRPAEHPPSPQGASG